MTSTTDITPKPQQSGSLESHPVVYRFDWPGDLPPPSPWLLGLMPSLSSALAAAAAICIVTWTTKLSMTSLALSALVGAAVLVKHGTSPRSWGKVDRLFVELDAEQLSWNDCFRGWKGRYSETTRVATMSVTEVRWYTDGDADSYAIIVAKGHEHKLPGVMGRSDLAELAQALQALRPDVVTSGL
jgi:hypothetical protein